MIDDHRIGAGVIDAVGDVVQRIRRAASALGGTVRLDAREELTSRMTSTGWRPNGRASAGGSCRLLRSGDGSWIALNLARPEDIESLPALFEKELTINDGIAPWSEIALCVTDSDARVIRQRAIDLGVPVAIVGERDAGSELVEIGDHGAAEVVDSVRSLNVVDLSSMWAGPLVGRVLADLGARVVKVESTSRPDGARQGPPDFFAALNGGKEFRGFDFRSRTEVDDLRRLIVDADVIIESSRPRALVQLGIDRHEIMNTGSVRAWLSITAHDRSEANATRVGFGDDAAAAGGLVRQTLVGPEFVGDAIADPITGLVGAAAILESLMSERRNTIDVSLAGAATHVAAGVRDPLLSAST
ncbi:MAG: CoA transferase [Actinomycetota bacterium]